MAKRKAIRQQSLFMEDVPVRGNPFEEHDPGKASDPINKYYVGVDNGTSGTIAIIKPSGEVFFCEKPVRNELSYTKEKRHISRVDFNRTLNLFSKHIPEGVAVHVRIERPMVNPQRFRATMSGMRDLEAMLILIEDMMRYPFSYIDSKEWQKALLPSGLKGDELKEASLNIGNRLFPAWADHKHKDRDALLIAEYSRRMRF